MLSNFVPLQLLFACFVFKWRRAAGLKMPHLTVSVFISHMLGYDIIDKIVRTVSFLPNRLNFQYKLKYIYFSRNLVIQF
jgi:hypothetical protein